MQIDIRHIAKLARLRIEEQRIEKFEKDMQSIVDMVETMPQVSVENTGVDPQNPMELRKDEICPSLRRDVALMNAPKTQAGCIVVPKTVE